MNQNDNFRKIKNKRENRVNYIVRYFETAVAYTLPLVLKLLKDLIDLCSADGSSFDESSADSVGLEMNIQCFI